MTNGIYYYYDTEKNSVVYVGRDSNIDKNKRHRDHMAKCNYDNQSFNSILQNNPDRYEYRIYCEGNFSNEELNDLEIQVIKLFDTHNRKDAFNFTEGGEGIVGFKHSEETRKKMSDALSGENNPMYGKKRSEETRKKISEANSGENNPRWKNYARVVKAGFNSNGKQKYALVYNGKCHAYSINKEELEELADRINKLENKDEEIINQIIEEYKPRKKNYATVIKAGINSNGKQNYALKSNGKRHTYNINKEELEKIAEEINKLENKDEETINQIIEEYKANKKNYATVIKAGIKHGKQNYALKQNGEIIKQSIYKEKLEKEVEERNKNQLFL